MPQWSCVDTGGLEVNRAQVVDAKLRDIVPHDVPDIFVDTVAGVDIAVRLMVRMVEADFRAATNLRCVG